MRETMEEIIAAGYEPVDISTVPERAAGIRRYMRGLERDDEAEAKIIAAGYHAVDDTAYGDDKRHYVRAVCLKCPHRKDEV